MALSVLINWQISGFHLDIHGVLFLTPSEAPLLPIESFALLLRPALLCCADLPFSLGGLVGHRKHLTAY